MEFDFWTSLGFGTPSGTLGVWVRYGWGGVLRARSTAAVSADSALPGGQHYLLSFTENSGPHDMRLDTSWTAGVQIVLDDGANTLVYDADPLIAAQRQLDGSVGANLTKVLGFNVTVDAAGRLNVSVKSFDGIDLEDFGGVNAAGFFNNDGEASGLLLGDLLTLVGRFTGITSVANWLRAMLRKTNTDGTAVGEINANIGAGAGTYTPSTDALEAIRDRGDQAWLTGTGSGSGSGVPTTPIWANAANPRYSDRQLAPIAQGSAPTEILTLNDGAGNPIDLTGRILRLVVYETLEDSATPTRYDDTLNALFQYDMGDEITLGPNENQVTIIHDVVKTATPGDFRYFLWDVTDAGGEYVLLKGRFPIEPAVKEAA